MDVIAAESHSIHLWPNQQMCVLPSVLGARLELSPQDQHSNGLQSCLTPPNTFLVHSNTLSASDVQRCEGN